MDWVPQCSHGIDTGPQILPNFLFYLNLDKLSVANFSKRQLLKSHLDFAASRKQVLMRTGSAVLGITSAVNVTAHSVRLSNNTTLSPPASSNHE